MIGWLGLATSLGGTIASGVGSYMANKKRERDLANQEAKANEYYMREMYADPTKRADNAAYLAQLDRRLKKQNEVAKNTSKITGATQEQAIATQEKTANAYADAISNLGAIASQRRDNLSRAQRQETIAYDNARNAMAAQQMENWGNLANNAMQLGSSALQMSDMSSGLGGKIEKPQATNNDQGGVSRNNAPKPTDYSMSNQAQEAGRNAIQALQQQQAQQKQDATDYLNDYMSNKNGRVDHW